MFNLFMLSFNCKRKKGLAMSIELLVVLIISIIVTSLVVLSTIYLKSEYKTAKTINEYRSYSEAMLQFKAIYGYWPGGIPVNEMPSNLNDTSVVNDIKAVDTAISTK